MLSVIIAAGALFTAVYDVLYKYNTTNTTILNAATVDKRGQLHPSFGSSTGSLDRDLACYIQKLNLDYFSQFGIY